MRAAEPIADIGWSSREEDAPMPARADRTRWTDASTLSFPLQLVIAIVASAIAAVVAVKSAQGNIERAQTSLDKAQIEIAGTLKLIQAQMVADEKLATEKAKNADLINDQMNASIKALQSEMRMTQEKMEKLNASILTRR
jgi:hypothetical protein